MAGCLSPSAQAGLVRLGTWMPFAHAAEELAHFWRVRVGTSTARRQTEAAGAAYVAVQTAAAEAVERAGGDRDAPAGPPRLFLSADGAMVPLVGGEWAEVKTLAVGALPPAGAATPTGRATALSYFSRLTDAATFTRLALAETARRGVPTAGTVVAVTDGSPWLQGLIDDHRPDAVRILDFPHAVEHLTSAAQATFGAGDGRAAAWVAAQAHRLKHDDPMAVLLALLDLPVRAAPQPEAAALARRATLCYLAARWDAIQYVTFQAQGYPIGDGAIESANKRIPEARLKGSGMRWARANVNPLLALRTVAANDRWAEAWPHLRAHTATLTTAQRQQRRQTRHATALPPAAPAPPPPSAPPAARPARRTAAVPARPPERARRPHPWSYQARLNAHSLPTARAKL